MADKTLPAALALMFGHEGGYSNLKTDKGGPTKYGITLATLSAHRGKQCTAEDVKRLTIAEAEAIYRKSYWLQSGGDVLPVGLDYCNFDTGVNSGPGRANRILQEVVGVTPDGIIGGKTLAAIAKYSGGIEKLILDYCDARMKYLRSLTNKKTGFPVNGRGWTIRVTGKDPKGQYKAAPGVVGNARALALGKMPATAKTVETVAQANPVDMGVGKTADGKAGAFAGVGVLGTACTEAANQIAPYTETLAVLRWLFIGLTVIGVAGGLYATIRRIQKGNG